MLAEPQAIADAQRMLQIFPKPLSATASFVQDAQLRSTAERFGACDEILEIHWAVRDAQLDNREIPNNYHPGVVRERHFALNWLTYYDDEWDEITTDT